MCGFYNASTGGIPVKPADHIAQFKSEIGKHDVSKFDMIGLYNGGNVLNNGEINLETLCDIFKIIAKLPSIRRVTIESMLQYLHEAKLRDLLNALNGKELEIGIGVESMNPEIRSTCIHKYFSNERLQKKLAMLRSLGIKTRIYLLFKPPFLTEGEAVADFVSSVQELASYEVDSIDCEAMTIQQDTLVHVLSSAGIYRVPWLWSIIEIIKLTAKVAQRPIYISPFRYIVPSLEIPANCDKCNERIRRTILDDYNKNLDVASLRLTSCVCKETWEQEMQMVDTRPIETRVLESKSIIEEMISQWQSRKSENRI